MLKIEDLKKELFIGDFGEYLVDYDEGYICDIITDIADNNIDIYTADLLNWIPDNYEYIEEANQEFGVPDDFLKQVQQGQFLYNERNLFDNLEDTLKNYMYNYIEYKLNIKEITEKQNKKLLDWNFSDNCELLENLIEHINEVLNIKED